MRTILKLVLALGVLGAAAAMGWWLYTFETGKVRTHTVDRGDVVRGVTISGVLNCRQKTTISAELIGLVRTLSLKEGDRVEKGARLMELDDAVIAAECEMAKARLDKAREYVVELKAGARKEEIRQAEETLNQAKARLDYAGKEHERLKRLRGQGGATESELEVSLSRLQVAQAELNAAQAQLGMLQSGPRPEAIAQAEAEVRLAAAELARCEALKRKSVLLAPHAGTVTVKYVNAGEVVSPGQLLLQLDNVDDIEVRAQAQETQLSFVAPGGPATVLLDAYPDEPLKAAVEEIIPRVDPQSGTIPVILKLAPPVKVALKGGMAADVALVAEHRRDVVRVPLAAIERRGDDQAVAFVRHAAGFERRTIRTGLDDGHWIEVREGLAAGDVIRAP